MKIYRPKKEPEAVVIDFEDGTIPAYIPHCSNYALEAIKKAAKPSVKADEAGYCPKCGAVQNGIHARYCPNIKRPYRKEAK